MLSVILVHPVVVFAKSLNPKSYGPSKLGVQSCTVSACALVGADVWDVAEGSKASKSVAQEGATLLPRCGVGCSTPMLWAIFEFLHHRSLLYQFAYSTSPTHSFHSNLSNKGQIRDQNADNPQLRGSPLGSSLGSRTLQKWNTFSNTWRVVILAVLSIFPVQIYTWDPSLVCLHWVAFGSCCPHNKSGFRWSKLPDFTKVPKSCAFSNLS